MRVVYDSDWPFVFDHDTLILNAESKKEEYRNNSPFSHVVLDDFLPNSVSEKLLTVFPQPSAPFWLDRSTKHQPGKLGVGNARRLNDASPFLHNIIFAFNSSAFIDFLEVLTGIESLIPDPHLQGGGIHQILPGGKLAIHADFNYNKKLKLYRRVNVLLYLNKDWQEGYGGHLELWDNQASECVVKITPIFNRCVIFSTSSTSFHGHPDPLNCPQDTTRKSLAFYYYSRDPEQNEEVAHRTLWQERPGEEF